jgi:uncharacterized protein YndB with AHSA1/START domain
VTTQAVDVRPINKTVVVPLPVEKAFQLFTDGIGTWWPFESHSIEGDKVENAVFDTEAGRLYERTADGTTHDWGLITAWEPPHRFELDWVVNPERRGSVVEVRFAAEGEGTRVDLEHRGWEHSGPEERTGYDGGWEYVLGKFVGSAG